MDERVELQPGVFEVAVLVSQAGSVELAAPFADELDLAVAVAVAAAAVGGANVDAVDAVLPPAGV